MAGQREEYTAARDRSSGQSEMQFEDSETGSPLQSEDSLEVKGLSSGWLLCFSDLQASFIRLQTRYHYERHLEVHSSGAAYLVC